MKKANTLMSSLRLMVAAMVVLFSYGTATAQSINCNGNLQVSLQQDPTIDGAAQVPGVQACFATLQLDDVLEGAIDPTALYTIQVLNGLNQILEERTGLTGDPSDDGDDNNGDGILDDAIVVDGYVLSGFSTYSLEGETLTFKVINENTGNACWGSATYEDKAGPQITCNPLAISCDAPLPGSGAGVSAIDNCSAASIQLVDERVIDADICPDNTVIIERDYIAVDANGNASIPCTQTITITRPTLVTFPDDIAFSCEQYQANNTLIDAEPLYTPLFGALGAFPGSPTTLDATTVSPVGRVVPGAPFFYPASGFGAGVPNAALGNYCNYAVSNNDDIVATCGDADRIFKVLRTWTVFDWCTNSVVTTGAGGADNIQVIKIVDVNEPLITGLPATMIKSASNVGQHPNPCNWTGAVAVPTLTDCSTTDLSTIDLDVFVYEDLNNNGVVDINDPAVAGATVNRSGTTGQIFNILVSVPGGLGLGNYVVVYQATDDCGNVAEATVPMDVVDNIAPTAICDEITDVNLSSDGLAVVQASVFDDGSYDNCGIDRFEVRRMNAPYCVNSDAQFGPTVTFCCADVNTTVMVVFRAVDFFGNTNTCMVEVNVQDKIAPQLVLCPQPQTITCDEYIALGEAGVIATYFQDAQFFDNCDFDVTTQVINNITNCNEGTITRRTTASDSNGSVVCVQTINVLQISNYVVEFPADLTITCTSGTSTDPTGPAGEPNILFDDCELVGVSFDDQRFDVVVDACYKIIRQWTVINWCVVGDNVDQEVVEASEFEMRGLGILLCDHNRDGSCTNAVARRTYRDSWNVAFQPGDNLAGQDAAPDTDLDLNPWDGYITYQQTIKVNDPEAPEVTQGDIDVCIEDNSCDNDVVLPLPLMDDCSDELDVLITGVFTTTTGIRNVAFTQEDVDPANLPVTNFVVADVVPGVYQVRYLVTDNCGNTTIVDITVTVRDCKKPTPYCVNGLIVELMPTTGEVELWANDFDAGSFDNCPGAVVASFDAAGTVFGRTFTCADLGQTPVTVYYKDAAGNTDFCETFVIIQDNMGACPGGNPQVAALGGAVTNEDDAPVQDVDVSLNGMSTNMMTGNDGMYNFNAVPVGADVSVVPSRDDNPTNGVTTYDIVLISKHILGSQQLDTPYKRIAADANASGNISTLDIVSIRKVILYIDNNFTNNTSWRFVDAAYAFSTNAPEGENFSEVINYNNIAASQMAGDFVAVKVGDVNGSATMNNLLGSADDRTNGKFAFEVADRAVQAGEQFTVAFNSNDLEVLGYQFTMNFAGLEFVSVDGAVATAENFGTTLLNEGVLTASWNGIAAAGTQFEVTFVAEADAQLSELLSINSRYTNAEAYTEGGRKNVALNFNGTEKAAGFELYQNTPNPFRGETLIGFNLPQAGTATLTIQDVSGKQIAVVSNTFAKGYNQVSVSASDLPATGVLYYTLKTENNTATKRMVLVK